MRKIIAYKQYFSDFIKTLSPNEVNKIRRALDLFKVEDKLPRHFIKFILEMDYMNSGLIMGTMSLESFSYMMGIQ